MAYEKYKTNALICGSFDRNTSDKTYLLFTREAGMVHAVATSVRKEKSKQRYALQDFSLVCVSLIQGKSGWKVTGAESISNLFIQTSNRRVRTSVHSLVQFVRRFVRGEEAQEEVFDEVRSVLEQIVQHPDENHEMLLKISIFRLLKYLGYIPNVTKYEEVLKASTSTDALPFVTSEIDNLIQHAVDRAYQESHL